MIIDPISATASIFGIGKAIFGGRKSSAPPPPPDNRQSLADQFNQRLEDNENRQREYNENVARITNAYNWLSDTTTAKDYIAQTDYEFGLAIKNWQHQISIKDYEHLTQQKAYQKSLGIASSQLNLNDLAQNQAFAFEDFNLKNLMKQTMFSQESELIAVQNAIVENQLNTKSTALDLAGVSQQEALLGIQKGGLGIKFQELGIAQKEIGIQQKALGIKKTGLVQEAQFIGKEETLLNQKNAIAQQFIEEQLNESKREATFQKQGAYVETLNKQGAVLTGQAGKSRGKAEQVVLGEFFRGMSQLESTLTGQNRQAALRLKELQSQTNFDKAKLQLKRDQLGLQAREMVLDERQLGLQAQQIGLAGAQLGLQGQQLGVQGQQLGTEAQRVNLQQQRYDVALENTITDSMFNMKVLDAEVLQAAEQATLNKKNIAIQKYGADLNTVSQMMIKPTRLPYPDAPTMGPERTMVATPIVIPQPVMESRRYTANDFGPAPQAQPSSGGGFLNTLNTATNVLTNVGGLIGSFGGSKSYGGSTTMNFAPQSTNSSYTNVGSGIGGSVSGYNFSGNNQFLKPSFGTSNTNYTGGIF